MNIINIFKKLKTNILNNYNYNSKRISSINSYKKPTMFIYRINWNKDYTKYSTTRIKEK